MIVKECLHEGNLIMRTIHAIIAILLLTLIILPFSYADDYTRWELPEGAELRLGKGKMANLEGHLTTIGKGNSYQFSSDNTKLAVITSIGVWLYDVMTGKEISLSKMNGYLTDNIILSPDLQLFANIRKHKIDIWDLNSNQIKTTLEGHTNSVLSVSFSSDGKMLASTGYSNKIRLWNIENGEHRVITTPHKIVSRVMFSPDRKTIVSSKNDEVLVWDIETGSFIAKLEDTTSVDNIVFINDGSALFCCTKHEARFWDTNTGKLKMRIELEGHYRHLFTISPDGQTLATARIDDYKVKLWNTQTGQLKNTLANDPRNLKIVAIANNIPKIVNYPTKRVTSITFSPDGRTLAVSTNGGIIFWNIEDVEPKFLLRENGHFYYLMFSPDGRTLAARCSMNNEETRIYLWKIDKENTKKSGLRHIIKRHNGEVSSIAFNNEGNILASGHYLEKIRLWDVVNGKLNTTCDGYPYQLYIQSLTFVPHGKTLASLNMRSAGKAEILFWNADTGVYQKSQKGHSNAIDKSRHKSHGGGIAYNTEGNIFVTGGSDGIVRIWDAKAAESDSIFQRVLGVFISPQKAKLKGHTDQITSVALSPDGSIAASGSKDKTICLWDVRNQKLIATLEGHTDRIQTVTFSPDGRTLASGCRDGSIHLWDPNTGKHKVSLIGNDLFVPAPSLPREIDDPPHITARGRSMVSSLVYSPDGKILANGNGDGSIYFWDMNLFQIISSFSGQARLTSLAYSPDGRSLTSGSNDGTILLWKIE